ncbi:MAG: hypothetical protein V1845_02265 [bacterium]
MATLYGNDLTQKKFLDLAVKAVVQLQQSQYYSVAQLHMALRTIHNGLEFSLEELAWVTTSLIKTGYLSLTHQLDGSVARTKKK